VVHDLLSRTSPRPRFRLALTGSDGEERGLITDEDWRAKFKELVLLVFDDLESARTFAQNHIDTHSGVAEDETRKLAGVEAKRLLEEFERLSVLHERVDRSLKRAINTYHSLRETGDEPPPWN